MDVQAGFELPLSAYLGYYTGMTELTYLIVIVLMAAALIILGLEYRRLKKGSRRRKLSTMLSNPAAALPEVKNAIREVAEFVVPMRSQRFRKRDRFYFHSRRLARKVQDNVGNIARDHSARKRAIQNLAKNFLRYADSSEELSSESEMGIGPAEEYLEEDSLSESGLKWAPPELSYLLNSFHMFGHFDQALFLELCQNLQTIQLPAGQYLFKIGDPDEFVFVVQSGKVNVHIVEKDGNVNTIKEVGPGDTVTSLLSFIDCLTGYPQPFKTVCCRAIRDSVVIKLPSNSFADVFEKNPDMLIKVVQLVMARLQRVVFVALHQYLGLSNELVRQDSYTSESLCADRSSDEAQADLNQLLETAVKGFQRELDFDNLEFLRDRVELRNLSSGGVIMTEDSHNDAALVYILSGSLIMSQRSYDQPANEVTLFAANAGQCVGQLAMLTGEANFYNCKAKENSMVAILTRDTFFEIVCQTPSMVLSLAHNTIAQLSSLVRQVDFALDWVNIESGKAIFRQSDVTDGTFIVLSGRFRSVIQKGSRKELVEEYAKGDIIGLVDVITGTERLTTVMAVRNAELCKVPVNLLTLLKTRYPVVVSKLISLLGHRLLGTWSGGYMGASKSGVRSKKDSSNVSYSTVALYPSSRSVPLTAFAMELIHSLTVVGLSTRLSSEVVRAKLGPSAFDPGHDYRLSAWLGQQEHIHKVVIYQCDYEMTKWTALCLRQADVIYDIVLADEAGEVSSAERDLEQGAKRTRKELILVHDPETETPRRTREYLKKRHWVSNHFHVKPHPRLYIRRNPRKLEEFYSNLIQTQVPNIHSDFSRLARHIGGASVGLVLGGGGARGAAHVGMLKAIQEAGIPVDKIGGVSIGAFVGGLWGAFRDLPKVTQKARAWFDILAYGRLGPIMDFTYPVTSLFTGAYFNSTLCDVFGTELMIEDMWLPFFCCTTDISVSQERVHTKGIFWKYCRASMTYAWLLPPLCDPTDGHLLMDGCYVNNVPGDVMAKQNCKYILAIDVTSLEDRNLTNYGESLSGWWLLWKKLNPFSSSIKIPDQAEIQQRLAFCSHYKNLEELKINPNYEYVQPPIEKYKSGDFHLFDEINDVGFHHGNTFFTGLRKASQRESEESHALHSTSWVVPPPGSSPPWFPAGCHYQRQWSYHRAAAARRNSGTYTFTDLAEMVNLNLRDGSRVLSRQNSNFPSRSSSVGQRPTSSTRRRQLSGRRSTTTNYLTRPVLDYNHSDDDSDDTGIVL